MSVYPDSMPILLVDDEEVNLLVLKKLLALHDIQNVVTMTDSRNVMPFLENHDVAVIVTDLFMPALSGHELLKMVSKRHPAVPVAIMTSANEINTAIECMREGACDYLVKPLDKSKLLLSIRRALELRSLNDEVISLRHSPLQGKLKHESDFSSIVTQNKAMRELFRYIEVIAASRQPVLITGETGVGKELYARTIHTVSGRPGAFVAVNVAGLDDIMFSDTLFGHKKGAFTGADNIREGLISTADNGTLFLDEIGDLAETSQIKLLRLIQEQEYYRLGSDILSKSHARIVIATNRDLKNLAMKGHFRKDLYYRLCTHQINIPPLRNRFDDIPLLLDHFIKTAARSMGKDVPSYTRELITLLSTYEFPGNVRELQAMVFDNVARSASRKLSLQGFKEIIQREREEISVSPDNVGTVKISTAHGIAFARFPTLKEAETELINRALDLAGGNQGIAASLLGITRQALNNRLRRNGG
jgi:two-component system response regulator HydG